VIHNTAGQKAKPWLTAGAVALLVAVSGCASTQPLAVTTELATVQPGAAAPRPPASNAEYAGLASTADGPDQATTSDEALPADTESLPDQASLPETPSAPVNISFTWVGDMTFGNKGSVPSAGVASILEHVRERLNESHITMGNLETAIGTGPTTKCGEEAENCYAFQAPLETGAALAEAGFNIVSLANNHSNDAGHAGVRSTESALAEAGVAWTGQRDQITYLEHDGVTIGFVAFAPYDSVANALNRTRVIEMVTEANDNADLVVVMTHLGAEGDEAQHVRPGVEIAFGENRGDPMGFSRAVIDAGADLVVGSGPHVLRGMEWYNGKLIAYSLGNFSGYHTLGMGGIKGVSGILEVTLNSAGEFVDGRLVPVTVERPGIPKLDGKSKAVDIVARLSAHDFGDNGVAFTDDGEIVPPTLPAASAPAANDWVAH